MDETKKKPSLKELLSMDLSTLTKKKSKETESASVTKKATKNKKIMEKKIPKRAIALDIGNNSIKIVSARFDKRRISIDNLIDIPTPQGAVSDGKILDSKVVSDVIEYALKENKINIKDVIFTTDSTSIINRELTIPKVDEEEIETVVRYEIQHFLPIDLNEYILEYTILEEIKNELDGKEQYRVNVISFPDRTAREYYKLFSDESDIKPYALDIYHNSLKKLINLNNRISDVEKKDDGTIAMIDMGAETININIYKNNELDFTRIIKCGGNDIDRALSEKLGISLKLVEALKIQRANLGAVRVDDELNDIVREVLEDWLNNIDRILQFYKNKCIGNKINNIFIYGGTSNIPGLEREMQEKFIVPTHRIASFDKVDMPKGHLSKEPIEKYINAMGAIIRL